jgi:hypothetical protein
VGTTGPQALLEVVKSGGDGEIRMTSANIGESPDPAMTFYSSRGTIASKAILQNSDKFFDLVGFGYDGSTYPIGVRIVGSVNGTPGANDMPGRLSFRTTADGTTTNSERFVIDNDGNIGLGGTITIGDANFAGASMVIKSGNVGIGTTSPGALLEVNRTSALGGTAGNSA